MKAVTATLAPFSLFLAIKRQSATSNNSHKIRPIWPGKNYNGYKKSGQTQVFALCLVIATVSLFQLSEACSRKHNNLKTLFVWSTGDSDEVHGQPHPADERDPERDKDPQVLRLGEGLPGAGLGPPEK